MDSRVYSMNISPEVDWKGLEDMVVKQPLVADVLNEMSGLDLSKNITIKILVQDFEKRENTSYEKKI